jgi:hypothetical protein
MVFMAPLKHERSGGTLLGGYLRLPSDRSVKSLTSSKLFDLIEIREAAPQQKSGSDGYTSGARGS